MLLILSERADQTVASVLPHLGVPHVWFDPAEFPTRARLTLRHRPAGGRSFTLETEREILDLETVRAVWLRRPGRPAIAPPSSDPRVRRFAEDECAELLDDVWEGLDAAWFPARRSQILRMQRKHMQLKVAADLGFLIPETLVTNHPGAFLDFYAEHGHGPGKAIVSKLVGPGFQRHLGDTLARYTEVVGPRDVRAYQSVAAAPAIFQEQVAKDREVRTTVVGDRVFTVEIHSQATRRTRGDWRRYDTANTPHTSAELPPAIADRCVAMTRRLGLAYSAIDLILRPDGQYVFLELNPTGQYLWLENLTGVPISRAIAAELARLARTGAS